MTYGDMPVLILLLASGYLLTIYLLLILAERTTKNGRYVASEGSNISFPPSTPTTYIQSSQQLGVNRSKP